MSSLGEQYFILPLVASVKLFFAGSLAYRIWLGRGGNEHNSQRNQDVCTVHDSSLRLEEDHCSSEAGKPYICVQLPLYNETGLVHGLLQSIGHLDWPHDRLTIQVLDDSDDPTCMSETAVAISQFRAKHRNLNLNLIQRALRAGFKAGALNEGMKHCPHAEFFAIFDADFRPEPDFLKRLHLEFGDGGEIACVQAAWSYENSSESALTRLQETLLNVHFHNDHYGRNRRGWVVNFNGTAGMWRKAALDTLGGWSASSVTEDLLLSYKAELHGMRVRYVDSLFCDSQLPSSAHSFLIQQRRWSRGHAQVLRQLRSDVLKKQGWSLSKKLDALFHLNSYSISFVIASTLVLAPAWVVERSRWVQSTPSTDAFRIGELTLWLAIGVLFFKLFSNHKGEVAKINSSAIAKSHFSRLINSTSRGLIILLSSPYLSVFMLESFLRGLFDSGQSKAGLVFHRTPKNASVARSRASMKPRDRAIVLALALMLIGLSFMSSRYDQWLSALIFFSQGVFVPLWLARRGW